MSDPQRVALKVAGLAVLVVALALGLVMGLSGCGDKDSETDTTGTVATTEAAGSSTTSKPGTDSALLGKWHSDVMGETIEFTADGEMIVSPEGEEDMIFSYTAEAGALTLTLEATAGSGTVPYSIDGDTLTIEDPEAGPTAYTRTQ
jgi:hypothetical protein